MVKAGIVLEDIFFFLHLLNLTCGLIILIKIFNHDKRKIKLFVTSIVLLRLYESLNFYFADYLQEKNMN